MLFNLIWGSAIQRYLAISYNVWVPPD